MANRPAFTSPVTNSTTTTSTTDLAPAAGAEPPQKSHRYSIMHSLEVIDSSRKRTRNGGDANGQNGTESEPIPITIDDDDIDDEDIDEPLDPRLAFLPRANLPTGLCYDTRMRFHCEVRPESDVHPEDPRRIYYIYKELCKAGLVDDPSSARPLVKQPLQRIFAREATYDEIVLVHTSEHFAFVKSTQAMSEDELKFLEDTRDSIYFNNLTFSSSLLSCGGAIETFRAVVSGKVKNAIAVIRPPGHHAEHDKCMGFCLFNNVSVATKACQKRFGDQCRKVLILDWDVHHGNGIQNAFYDDPNVLYISLHVYRDGTYYPGGDEGNYDSCGEGIAAGKNVNIPWPTQGMGDADYLYAFQEVVMPIAYEFDPDFVIISAGFDAASGDELGGCFVTPPCYAHMTHMLMNLANGKVAVCLEGGYNFRSISRSALAVTRTLMGEPPDRIGVFSPSKAAVRTVQSVKREQSKYWLSLYPKAPPHLAYGRPLHDIIRTYQTKTLYDDFKMTNLYIYRDSLEESFRNEVLATPDYDTAKTLLVIFHDPPELLGVPDFVSNSMAAQDCYILDSVRDYITWARKNGYAVIDVNVPKYLTANARTHSQREDRQRAMLSETLSTYVWENYIEPNAASEIFFIGVGNAFIGMTTLLVNVERVHQKISGVISFASENPVRAVSSNTSIYLSKWYKEHSLVFVSDKHSVWQVSKLSKRYGGLVRSPKTGLNEMMDHHKQEVFAFIQERFAETDESMDESD